MKYTYTRERLYHVKRKKEGKKNYLRTGIQAYIYIYIATKNIQNYLQEFLRVYFLHLNLPRCAPTTRVLLAKIKGEIMMNFFAQFHLHYIYIIEIY